MTYAGSEADGGEVKGHRIVRNNNSREMILVCRAENGLVVGAKG